MPSKSPAQHKLMEAAAHTPGGFGGVPQSVGKEFVAADESEEDREGEKNEPQVHAAEDEDDVHDSAGLILRAPDGKVLFLKRGPTASHPGDWDWPGGHVQAGETLMQGAIRETHEESGYKADPADLHEVSRAISEDIDFTAFICLVKEKFTPDIQRDEDGGREHDDFIWADLRDLPEPLHPSIKEALSDDFVDEIIATGRTPATAEDAAWDAVESAIRRDDLMALDEESVRVKDADGRLHVSLTPITKANVCPYFGYEIPNWQSLGLDPDKVYRLLRDPDEIKKGAATSNGIPLLEVHKAATAADHPTKLVVGAVGTDAIYEHPWLFNSLVIWPQDAIDDVETEFKRELSASYRYRPDMTPGNYEGEPFDGVMRDIIFNHLAQVESGRAGADVAVADKLSHDMQWRLVEEAFRGWAA